MTSTPGPANIRTGGDPAGDGDPMVVRRAALSALEVVPIGPNFLATLASFITLTAAPWICLHTLSDFWEDAIGDDRMAVIILMAGPEETVVIAGIGSLLFLVIGAILQVWHHHRPFAGSRPIALAFLLAWIVLVPESMIRGGTVLSGLIVGAMIGLAFAIHWGALLFQSQALD